MTSWEIDDPVVPPCPQCGMGADVECLITCPNHDFREAEFDADEG
jgi:hypothetical protein